MDEIIEANIKAAEISRTVHFYDLINDLYREIDNHNYQPLPFHHCTVLLLYVQMYCLFCPSFTYIMWNNSNNIFLTFYYCLALCKR